MLGRALIVLALSGALGLVARASDHLSYEPRLVFALGAPWLLLAFLSGLLWRRPAAGAAAGSLAVAISVGVYYLLMVFVEDRAGPHYGAAMVVVWGGLGLVVGAVFGAAGSAARSEGIQRVAAAALLGGALLGEAGYFLLRGQPEYALDVLALEAAVGLAVPLLVGAWRGRVATAVSLTAVLACAAFVADAALRVTAARYGWGGY